MIDVVIPTILFTDKDIFSYTLRNLNESSVVGKIIIIDNTEGAEFRTQYDEVITDKCIVLENRENTFVNPSWNQGMKHVESEHYLILNDDILCHSKILEVCQHVLSTRSEIGLLTVDTLQSESVTSYEKIMQDLLDSNAQFKLDPRIFRGRVGWFMCGRTKDWVDVPHTLKVFYGDDFIYLINRAMGNKTMTVKPFPIVHFESTTVNSEELFKSILKDIIRADGVAWKKFMENFKNGRYHKPS